MMRPGQVLIDAFLNDAKPHVEALQEMGWPIEVIASIENRYSWGGVAVVIKMSAPLPPEPLASAMKRAGVGTTDD